MIFRNWVLNNFPFLEDDFDALTDYELFCKMMEYIKKIANDNQEILNRISVLENYINNLDLQEEVNNKLDEMAESGELTDIIAQYLGLAGVLAYDTKSAMKSAENIANGSILKTLGNTTYNDGLGNFYKARTITNEDVIDDNNIIALHNVTLVAEKIPNAYIGDLTNLTTTSKTSVVSAINEVNAKTNNHQFVYGIIRPTSEGWVILNNSDHTPVNMDSVTIEGNNLIIRHNHEFTKVNSFQITPDETFAKYGITAGASVGLSSSRIDIFQHLICTGYIRYQNSEFVLNGDFSNLCSGVEWDDTNKCLVVTFLTNITNPTSWDTIHSYQTSGILSSQLQRNLVTVFVDTRVLNIYIYDNDGVQVTNKTAFDRLICTYTIDKKINPNELVTNPLSDANFWIEGIFE